MLYGHEARINNAVGRWLHAGLDSMLQQEKC